MPNFVLIAWTVAEIWPFSDFSKWRPSAIFDFEKLKILLHVRFGGLMCVTKTNFVPIGRTFAEIRPIFDFSRWLSSAILDLFYVYLDNPRREFVGLCRCAKFGWNRCSSFDNMPVLMFCEFGLKMPIHAHFWVVLGKFDPLDGYNVNHSPKGWISGW